MSDKPKKSTTVTCDFNEYNQIIVEPPSNSDLLCLEVKGQFFDDHLITLTSDSAKKLVKSLNNFLSQQGRKK